MLQKYRKFDSFFNVSSFLQRISPLVIEFQENQLISVNNTNLHYKTLYNNANFISLGMIFDTLRLLFKYFCLHPFFPYKIQFFLLFAQFSDVIRWPHGGHQRVFILKLSLQIAEKCIFLRFFLGIQTFMRSFEDKLTRKIHTTLLYAVCKYLNQRVRRIDEQNGKSLQGVSKIKNEKNMY